MPPALTGGSGSDLDDDAQPAFIAQAVGKDDAPFTNGSVIGEDDGPSLEMLEAQMEAEVSTRDRHSSASPGRRLKAGADEDDEVASPAALPELGTLVERLPVKVRETLDELFRVRFVTVKQLPKRVFNPLSAKVDPNSS